MPKYNLMDNKDPDSLDHQFDKEIKKTDKAKKPVTDKQPLQIEQFEQPEADSQISEEIFDSAAISAVDDEAISTPPEINIPQADDIEEAPAVSEKHKTPEFVKPSPRDYEPGTDYEDKQPGLNYKPVLYIVGAIAAIIIIYFGISRIFFSAEGEEAVEAVSESPEQRQQREENERKQMFLAGVNNSKQLHLGQVNSLIDIRPSNITYSSILLYGESLTLEVFARNRDDLANFNLILKNNPVVTRHKIETVDTRPGKKGGLFAVYDIKMREQRTGAASSASFAQISPAEWITNLQLKMKTQRQIATGKDNLFSTLRQEYIFNGSEQNCHDVIKKMLSENANFDIHKLSLIPSNQTSMSASSFQLKLVVDFYL